MDREEFLKKLKELADTAQKSPDRIVVQSAVTLLGLAGSIQAGPDFFEAFTDSVFGVIRNQRALLG